MAENTGIEWTWLVLPKGFVMGDGTVLEEELIIPGYTMNAWWGCVEVSPGCAHCYAKTWDKRMGGNNWGLHGTRRMMSEANMRKPYKWNEDAKKKGIQPFVFASSMADVFEDHPQVMDARNRLFKAMEETPHLVWLMLTKRIENVERMAPAHWLAGGWPTNVWLGTTVENQPMADRRLPELLKYAELAPRLFLSCEPLVGWVDLDKPYPFRLRGMEGTIKPLTGDWRPAPDEPVAPHTGTPYKLSWVIIGGESGDNVQGIRPMHPRWAGRLIGQCEEVGVPVFFKQWGRYLPVAAPMVNPNTGKPYKHVIMGTDGKTRPATWNEVLASAGDEWAFADVGKKRAGHEYFGQVYHGRPQPFPVQERVSIP